MTTPSETTWLAGAAKADISPAIGIQIAGDIGRRRPCTGVTEPIYARALVLEQGGERYAILSIDVLAIDNPWSDEIRRRAANKFGLAFEAIMVHITQNHAAPSIGNHFCKDQCDLFPAEHQWLRGGDQRYNEPAVAGAVQAIGDAIAKLTPVDIAVGRTMDSRVAFNRRFVMRDGTTMCHPPLCSPDILHAEGPMDPEVSVVSFTDASGQVVAAMLHHTSHPCHGFGSNDVLAGWPGAWCDLMQAHFGAACTPLVINGCCGNIHHMNHTDPTPMIDHKEMASKLAESAKRALENATPLEPGTLTWERRILPVPRREVPAQTLADAQQMLRDHPQPLWKDKEHIRVEWDWVYAIGIIDIADDRATDPNYPYEIQALRIGDFALLSLMGEPFVEAQLSIKGASPFSNTQIAHMSNGYLGYVPTQRAFNGGGYETRIGRGSRLVPEALEMVEQASIALLKKLHAR